MLTAAERDPPLSPLKKGGVLNVGRLGEGAAQLLSTQFEAGRGAEPIGMAGFKETFEGFAVE